MHIREVLVNNQSNETHIAATFYIQKANQYKSQITIESDEKSVDGKSLLGMLSLNIQNGKKLRLKGIGSDEVEAINTLADLFENGETNV